MQSTLSKPAANASAEHSVENRYRLFLIGLFAVTTAGISFSLRGSIAGDIQMQFFDPVDPIHSGAMIATALGVAFLGFAITIFFGSPLVDWLGMGRVLTLSMLSFATGTLLTIFADRIAHGAGVYRVVWFGMLFSGIGWGSMETVINPLTTTLYPEDKVHRLNVMHAWWPGGIIMGGLIGLAIGRAGLSWRLKFAVVLIPAAITLFMLIGSRFPKTERAAAGIPAKDMWKEALRPGFIVWFACMFLTAASELAPGQWVDMALTRTVGMKGIWLLIYVSGLMFVMRQFSGPVIHKISSVGLLWISCLFASAGLVCLSAANSPVMGILAATVWGVGVCFMWPTMLAAASERYPRGGALIMGLIGTAGSLSIYFVLPQMGKIFDHAKVAAAGGEEAFKALSGEPLNQVLIQAAQSSFRTVAVLPALLLLVFGAIWLRDRSKGGYKPGKL
jgi:MFS family permease